MNELSTPTSKMLLVERLYFRCLSVDEISEKTKIPATEIKAIISANRWKQLREQNVKELVADIKVARSLAIPQAIECGMNLIVNALRHRVSTGEVLSLYDAKIVSSIISDIDKLARLDAGEPTSISEVNRIIPTTLEELKKIVARDPFIDTIELTKDITYDTKENDNAPMERIDGPDPSDNNRAGNCVATRESDDTGERKE